jgi:hypothetical protein
MSTDLASALRLRIAVGDTAAALRDRVWTMGSGASVAPVLEHIDPATGGLVLTGATALAAAKALRSRHPELPLLIAPTAPEEENASSERPFIIKTEGVLFEQTVDEVLDAQRRAGADMVITPSGQIAAEDPGALKAVINGANAISDPDVLTLVAVHHSWLLARWRKTLRAVLRDSEHPVLLGIAHSFANPLDTDGAIAGYQELATEIPSLVGWHTDLSGLGLVASGGLGAAIGLRPSGRRYAQVRVHPKASDKRDKTPHVLLPDLLRYTRTSIMQKEWFAQATPDTCMSPCCRGRAIDRFDDSDESVTAAHTHNTTRLYEMASELCELAPSARPAWWRRRVQDAVAAHEQLGERIRREVKPPADLARWSALLLST